MITYMNRRICSCRVEIAISYGWFRFRLEGEALTDKGSHITNEAYAKGKALSRPIALIESPKKHILCRPMWR